MLHIVVQIVCYYVGEKESLMGRRLCGFVTNIFFFSLLNLFLSSWTMALSVQFVATRCILTMWSVFGPPSIPEGTSCQLRSGKAGGNSPGSLADPIVTAHLVLNQREESRVKKKKKKRRLTQYEPSIPAVKWLILLVTMVTINSVSRTFVPGRFEQTPPPFYGAKWFFTKEEKHLFCMHSKESHPNGGSAFSPPFKVNM